MDEVKFCHVEHLTTSRDLTWHIDVTCSEAAPTAKHEKSMVNATVQNNFFAEIRTHCQ